MVIKYRLFETSDFLALDMVSKLLMNGDLMREDRYLCQLVCNLRAV